MARDDRLTDEQCQRLFDAYNVRFFAGRLPRYRILRTDKYGRGEHGLCRKKQREIHLGTGLKGAKLKEVLLHEMAHAATRGTHGKPWLAEMLRLAKMGAPTRKDWESYRDPAQTLPFAAIECECYDGGLETDLPWSKFRPCVGQEYGLTDSRGRAESAGTAELLRRLRKEFVKGRRDRRVYLLGAATHR